jgi:galactose mutarotase-like enzyme
MAGVDMLALSFASTQFHFARSLHLDGGTLIARYSVTNLDREPLPYLWALHALLAVEPDDTIELAGVDKVRASSLSLGGRRLPVGELSWSGRSDMLPFTLDKVQPARSVFAGKFLVNGLAGSVARVGHPGQWLEISWDQSIEHLGIWLTYGGWPAPGGHHEAALEPTNSPADDLGQAIDAGVVPLAAGERREWCVTLTVGPPSFFATNDRGRKTTARPLPE